MTWSQRISYSARNNGMFISTRALEKVFPVILVFGHDVFLFIVFIFTTKGNK